jgi:hypothetical protein
VALNLVETVVGVGMGLWVLVVVLGGRRRRGVADVKARLGIGAMVAGNFEDQGFNADARGVGELFAELRGGAMQGETRRVGVRVGESGERVLVGVD